MKGLTKLIYLLVIVVAFAFSFMALFNAFTGISVLPAFVTSIGFFGSMMVIVGSLSFMMILYAMYKTISNTTRVM